MAFKKILHANSNQTQNPPKPNPLFIFLALSSVWLSPNQANNYEKLTLINIQKTRQWIAKEKNMKQVEKKTKPVNRGWISGLYQVSSGAGDGGVSR
jgi:hypothetical protein